ncbi:MAG: cell wall-active antibiotics response protein [Thermicanus sp.]|nr:cell wall-active antibiotics response protein [Thermicanus sp.]
MEGYNKRNTVLIIAAALLYLLIQKTVGDVTLVALLFFLLGFYRFRTEKDILGYLLLGIGAFIFLTRHLTLIFFLLVLLFGINYYWSRRKFEKNTFVTRGSLLESLRWDKEAWTLESTHFKNLVGEYHIDLSLAFTDQDETEIIMEGLVGNVEIWVPEDYEVTIEAAILIGQVDMAGRKEGGILNRIVWHSPQGEAGGKKVKFMMFFLFGSVEVKGI